MVEIARADSEIARIDGVLPFIALERSAGERRPAFRTEFHAWGRPLFLTQHNADPARNSGG